MPPELLFLLEHATVDKAINAVRVSTKNLLWVFIFIPPK